MGQCKDKDKKEGQLMGKCLKRDTLYIKSPLKEKILALLLRAIHVSFVEL